MKKFTITIEDDETIKTIQGEWLGRWEEIVVDHMDPHYIPSADHRLSDITDTVQEFRLILPHTERPKVWETKK